MKTAQIAFGLGMLLLGITAGALASPPPDGARPEPPPFAFEACASKAEGDPCTVQFHDQTKQGTCRAHSDKRLFCMPKDMPPPPQH